MIQLFVGGLEVLDSGSVIVFNNEPLEFIFDDGNGELTVRCLFETNENYPAGHLLEDEENEDERELTLRFVNFNAPVATRSKKAVEIGMYEERKLYLRYIVDVVDGYKQLLYTWYLK